jgi:hypothetical protein
MVNLVNSFQDQENIFRSGAHYYDQDTRAYWDGEEVGARIKEEIADMITPKHNPKIIGLCARLTRGEIHTLRIRIRINY